MRDHPTQAEELCAQALADAFSNEGHAVIFPDRDTKDKPDILIEIAGVLVACECTQVPPSYIYQYQYKKYTEKEWPHGEILSITWPNEPHKWIADAISKKATMVPDYLARTGARESWLLIHSPPESNQFFVEPEANWIQWSLRHGSKIEKHPFRQIHLWTPKGGILPISILKNEAGTHLDLGIDFSKGYPTLCVNRTTFKFKTTKSGGKKPNSYTYEFNTRASRTVEPKDEEYSKHPPATREASYRFEVLAWEDRAEIRATVQFLNPDEICELDLVIISDLSPDMDYWHHGLHEFRAPKKLSTLHRIQPHE